MSASEPRPADDSPVPPDDPPKAAPTSDDTARKPRKLWWVLLRAAVGCFCAGSLSLGAHEQMILQEPESAAMYQQLWRMLAWGSLAILSIVLWFQDSCLCVAIAIPVGFLLIFSSIASVVTSAFL